MSSKTTLLPDYTSIVQNTSLDFYNKSTNLLNVLGSYLAEINEQIKFNKSLVTTDFVGAYASLYNTLASTNFTVNNFTVKDRTITANGTKPLDNTFILFFIEKYLSLSQQYKDRVTALSNSSYFEPFSDDIGTITDTDSILDNNVVPYFDIYNQQHLYPTYLPASLHNKVSNNELKTMKTFSLYADALLKVNLIGLQNGDLNLYSASTSHGTNLITDALYYKRAISNQHDFLVSIQVILGDINNFILFFKDLNPKDQDSNRYALLNKYTITNLEGLQLQVDNLKNNINKVILSTQDVLSTS